MATDFAVSIWELQAFFFIETPLVLASSFTPGADFAFNAVVDELLWFLKPMLFSLELLDFSLRSLAVFLAVLGSSQVTTNVVGDFVVSIALEDFSFSCFYCRSTACRGCCQFERH